jgi:hypothetical protein
LRRKSSAVNTAAQTAEAHYGRRRVQRFFVTPSRTLIMTDKLLPPPTEAAIFEAGYLAATLRARREFTWAKRAAILSVLSAAAPDPRVAEPETPEPALRSFALIMARCESAATLLGWRKQITPEQKRRLDTAIHRLQEAAAQVAVRANVHDVPAKRFDRVGSHLKPHAVVSPLGQPPYLPVNGSALPRDKNVRPFSSTQGVKSIVCT